MVMQMYKKWAESRHFGVTVVDEMAGEIAGIKVCVLLNTNLRMHRCNVCVQRPQPRTFHSVLTIGFCGPFCLLIVKRHDESQLSTFYLPKQKYELESFLLMHSYVNPSFLLRL